MQGFHMLLIMRIVTITVFMVAVFAGGSLLFPQAGYAADADAPIVLDEPAKPAEKPIKLPLTEVIGIGPNALEHIPGSGRVVTREELERNHRFTINEALREVPGVNVRDEDGFGLRPNIGLSIVMTGMCKNYTDRKISGCNPLSPAFKARPPYH